MNDICLTCGGTPPVSGLPCICGGHGTRDAETDGLRRHALALEEKLRARSSMNDRIDRLLRPFHLGQRVRAVETIIYGTGEEVPEGAIGYIRQINVHGCTPLVTVTWSRHPCSVESLEPAP